MSWKISTGAIIETFNINQMFINYNQNYASHYSWKIHRINFKEFLDHPIDLVLYFFNCAEINNIIIERLRQCGN